ncbi:MAG: hypothetical protein IJ491_09595 [Clostridia bacterium]|nr:hypothetical protein [Clostridia bacterium]
MKKKTKLFILILIILLLIPVPNGTLKDGGTKTFTALTYKIVSWNRLVDAENIYSKTEFYIFPLNFFGVDRLWNIKNRAVAEANSTQESETAEAVCPVDHSPAKEEQNVPDAYEGGWCGNTQATIVVKGKEYTFMMDGSITLNALYLNHSFKDKICECDDGIQIKTEKGNYTVNLEKYFIRSDKGQGQLTEEQAKEIKEIIERQTAN